MTSALRVDISQFRRCAHTDIKRASVATADSNWRRQESICHLFGHKVKRCETLAEMGHPNLTSKQHSDFHVDLASDNADDTDHMQPRNRLPATTTRTAQAAPSRLRVATADPDTSRCLPGPGSSTLPARTTRSRSSGARATAPRCAGPADPGPSSASHRRTPGPSAALTCLERIGHSVRTRTWTCSITMGCSYNRTVVHL